MAIVKIRGRRIRVDVLGWRTLKTGDFDTTQDTTVADIWEWFAEKVVPDSLVIGFDDRRNRKAALKFLIYKDTTSEIADAARIRLVIYKPDRETQDCILLDETYGTLKNASRDDINKLITPTVTKNISAGYYVVLECKHTTVLDVSESSWELGHLLMSR